MSGIKDSKELNKLRDRLYARGENFDAEAAKTKRHKLSKQETNIPDDWEQKPSPTTVGPRVDSRAAMPQENLVDTSSESEAVATEAPEKPAKPRRLYRLIILGISLFLFIVVAGLASVYLFFGGNQISGSNIEVALSGPASISGGDTLPLQIGVTNQNSVPIESVTLIIEYPDGIRSTGENATDLFEERIPLNNIEPGETINVPVRVTAYGEESERKTIEATIEYRLRNSNGTFFKEAQPYEFQVQSAALVIGVDSIEQVASGQEVEVTLNIRSNSQTPLRNVLVNADYPDAFDYSESSPQPVYGQGSWLIEELQPDETETIVIRGVVRGLTEEETSIRFQAGTPQADNQFMMGAVLANSSADFVIEEPFINVALDISKQGSDAVLPYQSSVDISVDLQNTLSYPIYELAVEVSVSGNIIDEQTIDVTSGFYNSIEDVVRFDQTGNPTLEEVPAGASRKVSFKINPNALAGRASMQVEANVFARRVLDNEVTEELIGFVRGEAKFTSSASFLSEAGRNTGAFLDFGPIPPVAEETTSYTITLAAEAGANDMVDTVVTTSLPQYVDWQNKVEGYGDIEFNPVSKRLTWNVGDVTAEERATISFQVAITPSLNQIGEELALVGVQNLRGVDRFTGEVLRDDGQILNTTLSSEAGFNDESGVVVAPE